MYQLSLNKIAQALRAEPIGEDIDQQIEPSGASIDTRTLKPGQLFFAFKGEKTDGHAYLSEAQRLGAVAAVVSYIPPDFQQGDFPLFLVADVEKALQQLAELQRSFFQGPLIAITGSTGKTTTKDMLTAILSEKGEVLSTQGNYNNELGLPLTLLSLEEKHWAMVTEMGMDALGEIDRLGEIAKPTHGIITNIGHSHQEILGSQERIAQAKAELFPHVSPTGGMVLNKQDEALLNPWLPELRCPVKWVACSAPADIWVGEVWTNKGNYGYTFQICTEGEEVSITLNIPGRHNIINSLSAVGIARQLGLSWEEIRRGLSKIQLTPMRLEIIHLEEQKLTVINDAYNANPASMASALEVLQTVAGKGRKIAVLGDMYELGDFEVQGHLEVGKKAVDVQLDYLFTVGKLARYIAEGAITAGFPESGIGLCQNNQEALSYLKKALQPGDVILIKGSRGVKMEEIVTDLARMPSI
ncbi:MAG: UDP-N-acetylmuramoyl-tripeptide--D-alanyl-D-alanine ligase [Peptococcia bacterium]